MTSNDDRTMSAVAIGLPPEPAIQDRELESERYGSPPVDWALLVDQVRSGEPAGLDELYRLFARGIRFHICRQLGTRELDDRVHDTFLVVVQAIQKGDLRDPERLMGWVRTIVRRQIATYISESINDRREQGGLEVGARLHDRVTVNPESGVISSEMRKLIERVLERMNERDREILTRFYLYEQTQEQICEAMDISETQFRLLKSRAKARFGELGKKKLQQSALCALSMRTSAGVLH